MQSINKIKREEDYKKAPSELQRQFRTENREAFDFVIQDLSDLPKETPIIAEGAGFYPDLLLKVSALEKIIYFIPDEDLVRKVWTDRYKNTPWLDGYSEPELIIENFTRLSMLEGDYIRANAEKNCLKFLTTSIDSSIPGILKVIQKHFKY